MAIGRGDLNQAVAEHLFGPILFASFVVAIVHITLELLTRHRITAFYCQLLKLKKLQIFGIFAIFIYYLFRMYHLSKTGEIYIAFSSSPLGQLLAPVTTK
jgi:hypothetical protein